MTRKCPYIPLSKQPLVLVLCQVRFSPVRRMEDYVARLQDAFRRIGFPTEQKPVIEQFVMTPAGIQFNVQRWEYRDRGETSSIVIAQESVALVTTDYDRFERFADTLTEVVRTTLAVTEQDKLGLIHRIGLRYIDLIEPNDGEDFTRYLRAGFHGVVTDSVFKPGSHRVAAQSVGQTLVQPPGRAPLEGTLALRVSQNTDAIDVPPDLVEVSPHRRRRLKAGRLVTLVDMDHYLEGSFEPDVDWIIAQTYAMHDTIIEAFHNHVVTPEAIEAWR